MCFDIMFVPAGQPSIRAVMGRSALREAKALGSFPSSFRFSKKLLVSEPVFFLCCILPPPLSTLQMRNAVHGFSVKTYTKEIKN